MNNNFLSNGITNFSLLSESQEQSILTNCKKYPSKA